ncbi:MAG: hypothetical protein ACLP0J_05485 [Solirubrobacteraceae bacterium]
MPAGVDGEVDVPVVCQELVQRILRELLTDLHARAVDLLPDLGQISICGSKPTNDPLLALHGTIVGARTGPAFVTERA